MAQRPNAVGIAERQQAMAGDQRHHGIGAAQPLVHVAHGGEHVLGLQRHAARGAFELVRQHVEQHLGVALGVGVAVVGGEQLGAQRMRVGEVAVVHQHDAERRVHVEGLRLFLAVGVAGGRVAHLAQARRCPAAPRMLRVRNTSRTMPLALCMKNLRSSRVTMPAASWPRCCSSSKRVVEQLVDGCVADNADDSTHGAILF